MATSSQETILRELSEFISKGQTNFALWYCGITSDIAAGLFKDHNVGEFGANWKWREAVDDTAARWVEKSLRTLGCKGARANYEGGRRVYIYKIVPTSIE